jgi:hypothetical protein
VVSAEQRSPDELGVLIVSADEDAPSLLLGLRNGDGTLADLITVPLMGQ